MKKIKKNFTWIRIAETVVVIWAIHGMFKPLLMNFNEFEEASSILFIVSRREVNGFLVFVLTYFLSAVLILYLLRRYKKQNKS